MRTIVQVERLGPRAGCSGVRPVRRAALVAIACDVA